jgi:hypothetical protein
VYVEAAVLFEKVKFPLQAVGMADATDVAVEVAAEVMREAVAVIVEVGIVALKDPDMVSTAARDAVALSASCRAFESTRKNRSEPSVRQKAKKRV